MKLYNRTKLPDELLAPLLVAAGRSVGARTEHVSVTVNRALHTVRGTAHECSQLQVGQRWVKTDGGYFRISLPFHPSGDALRTVQVFLWVARHEWGHIRDYQAGGRGRLEWSKRTNGRRPVHESRPEEIRANNYIYDSDAKLAPGYWDGWVLALALAYEQIQKGS
jgi:hypothetical protein